MFHPPGYFSNLGLSLSVWLITGAVTFGAADDQEHWSFRPVGRMAVPSVRDQGWVRNPIDAFVLARLESLGISPAPEADRSTLLRRLSLDLLGLPPRPADVQEFLADQRPDAYERLVDRFLSSPHFGERWGRHWLDLARYADSDGYEKDSPRPYAYLYRNWVIDAINRDLPFDRFTIEQIAGDLLPDATLEQRIATGFHRNTLTNREGGVDQEEYRNKANVDRVNTTGTVWLGLTVGCAECHSHKYDPIAQREYYGLFAFFNTARELDVPIPQPAEQAAYEKAKRVFDAEQAKLRAELDQFEKEQLAARRSEWERTLEIPDTRWEVLDPVSAVSAGGATLLQQPDGSILISGKKPAEDSYTLEMVVEPPGITAFRVEVLPDATQPMKGPGRSAQGNFVLSELRVLAEPRTAAAAQATPVRLCHATASFSQQGFEVETAIDDNLSTGWAVAPRSGQWHVAVFETKDDVGSNVPTRLQFTLEQRHGAEHTIGRFRISATTRPRPVRADGIPDEVVNTLRTAPGNRTAEHLAALAEYHRTVDPEWQKRYQALQEHARKAPPAPATAAMTVADNPRPPKTQVHIRGDFLRKGEEVQAGTLGVLHPFTATSGTPNRLDLANWLVDAANPLTPRVTMNRIWQHLFGKGLVATVEDFGTRGEPPSHPELLDWLATELVVRGWSRKEMVKLIIGSATYRQSSNVRPDLIDRDPNNILLARQNRYRLEAEVVRDLGLAASGLLNPVIGGPSVRPPQPAGISDLTYAGSAKWITSSGSDRYRRGLYTWFQRTSPYPMLMTFDAPDGNVCSGRRERSNTPLQALTLLNDSVFVECAQAMARRLIVAQPPSAPDLKIRYAFQLCMAREPAASEQERLGQLTRELLEACKQNPDDAARLVGAAPSSGTDVAEAAAWVAVCRTLLNLDEFVTRE